jgi:hypothetical protein
LFRAAEKLQVLLLSCHDVVFDGPWAEQVFRMSRSRRAGSSVKAIRLPADRSDPAAAKHGQSIHRTARFIVALSYSVVLGTGVAGFFWWSVIAPLGMPLGAGGAGCPGGRIRADCLRLGARPGRWESLGLATLEAGPEGAARTLDGN